MGTFDRVVIGKGAVPMSSEDSIDGVDEAARHGGSSGYGTVHSIDSDEDILVTGDMDDDGFDSSG